MRCRRFVKKTYAHQRRRHMAGKLFASAKGGAFFAIRRSLDEINIFLVLRATPSLAPAFQYMPGSSIKRKSAQRDNHNDIVHCFECTPALLLLISLQFSGHVLHAAAAGRLIFPRPFSLSARSYMFCANALYHYAVMLQECIYMLPGWYSFRILKFDLCPSKRAKENHKPNWLHAANDHHSQNSLKSIVHKRISVSLRNTAVRLECSDENEKPSLPNRFFCLSF